MPKMRNETKCRRPNMTLHLNGIKDQKWSKGAHLEQIPFLGEKERRKGEKS